MPISYSSYTETSIAGYQAASDPSQPLKSMTPAEQDRVWVEICAKLKHATWSLKIELDASDGGVRGNTLVIKGKATFRPRGSREDAIPGMAQAFEMMDVQLVPFVFAFHSGWWAQTPLKPERDGQFQSSVYIGRPGTIDVGKDYQTITCAVSRRFNAWNKSLDNLPPVRIESNSLEVKRVA